MRISDWSSDVCSSDLCGARAAWGDLPQLGLHSDQGAAALVGGLSLYHACRCLWAVGGEAFVRSGQDRGAQPQGGGAAQRGRDRPDEEEQGHGGQDRKSTRLTPVTNAHRVCRLLLDKN